LAVPWRTGNRTLYRYYYLFSRGELEKLSKRAGFAIIRSFPERRRLLKGFFDRNVFLLLRKEGNEFGDRTVKREQSAWL
jgi:hypothetical protein